MKRTTLNIPRRPARASANAIHTHRDAAIHLVRLEFDNARLKAGIAQAESRAVRFRDDLTRNEIDRATLLSLLGRNF